MPFLFGTQDDELHATAAPSDLSCALEVMTLAVGKLQPLRCIQEEFLPHSYTRLEDVRGSWSQDQITFKTELSQFPAHMIHPRKLLQAQCDPSDVQLKDALTCRSRVALSSVERCSFKARSQGLERCRTCDKTPEAM